MVEHVLARQVEDAVGVRHEEALRLGPHLGLVALDPFDLRADRLRRHAVAADLQDPVRSVALGQLVDLQRRTGVDAVEDRRAEGASPLVGREEDGPDARDAQAGDVALGARGQPAADLDDVLPPHLVGIVFGPSGLREGRVVADDLAVENVPLRVGEDSLRRTGADVNADDEFRHTRSPLKECILFECANIEILT